MWKTLQNLLDPRFQQLEADMTQLKRQLQSTLEDAADLHEKTYRLHQRLVKRAQRDVEGSDRLKPPNPVKSPRELANERILARRRGRNGIHPSVPDAGSDEALWPGAAEG